ncbi:SAM-dependent methyltransferase [Deinococcus metalli]|uniref:S-adenosyl-L-methionine (SAM)-dependent methyltransferase PhcB n=1 Tax=Deinococcus metalli TaxID=1141878 RepID=A0A7W8KGY7_9DEIO|nr:methyltransferase domain-containing protein [Deinococcus metalli]MBB5376349.1 SAM-dependent methyltransferase [Deinococcus metalli]GHF38950.1 S-adenosyl-L-methionine (SAM)-dependent methyltransferase PhcB [Deinococcus metalli]
MSDPTSSATQFNAHADKYAASEVHRSGASLPVLLDFAAPGPNDDALDVATGTGNTALALAPHVARVTGLDLAEGMLEHARARASAEGQRNATFVVGSAEALPFPDASFTLVTSRHAPHHFHDLGRFLAEAHRVLTPGGRLVVADQISPTPELQPWIDMYQRRRDPSHVQQRTVAAWRDLAEGAGLRWAVQTVVPYRLDFAWWTAQSGTSLDAVQELRDSVATLTPAEQAAIGAEFGADGHLLAHVDQMMVVRLEKPAAGA